MSSSQKGPPNTGPTPGYYRWPTLAQDQIVFVSEDDLWTVKRAGGVARRLSSGLGMSRTPALSPDGQWLAFASTEEGTPDVYMMPSGGGRPERITFIGGDTAVVGWTPDGDILFTSNHEQAFGRLTDVYRLDPDTRDITHVACGPATHADFDEQGRLVIARHSGSDLAYWKRYRGGRAGEIWIDRDGQGKFEKLLLNLNGNTARPYLVGGRVFFLSDHEGIGNIYSVALDGTDLRVHTQFRDFYVRGLQVSKVPTATLIFHAGAEVYTLEVGESAESASPQRIVIDYRSPRTQMNRRFVSAADYLEDYELHPSGEKAVIGARGKTFSFGLWKGPVTAHGPDGAVRYRLGRFMRDGKRLVVLSDAGGEESLEIHEAAERGVIERMVGLDLGRTLDIKLSPTADEAVLINHRNELIWVDLAGHKSRVLDRSYFRPIGGFNWSHDGKYIAYGCSESDRVMAIRVCEVATGEVRTVTRPILRDVSPFFDPSGDYLYFLSFREFDPVYDALQFDLGFPRGGRPYLITLRKDVKPPFGPDKQRRIRPRRDYDDDEEEDEKDTGLKIDFEGIEDRVVAFPVADGRFRQIAATHRRVFFTRLPIEGSLRGERTRGEARGRAVLECFDLESEKVDSVVGGISSFRLSHDGEHIICRSGHGLRVFRSNERPSKSDGGPGAGGWIDLDRVQVPVTPPVEWRQMYREAWRLQRDHFWSEDMGNVDWSAVFDRYFPLLDRVGCRSEVSDLLWEMHGELGTSHAYESGGDYRQEPHYGIGYLGVETEFDESTGAYKITRVMRGDLWDERASSPLARPGIGLVEGDFLVAVEGLRLSRELRPEQCLVHRSGKDVTVAYRRQGETELQTCSVRALRSEQRLRYREWVNRNKRWVHEQGHGRIGYVHIPNMGPLGYAEFHRAFLQELDRDGLIIDVRFNGGGHVSQLILEKLARRRIGYSKSRWFGAVPYPEESPAGPMVALTNEYAGSDGDIFSHAFKLLHLGPLIGKRTWGGVIGINPSHSLVDGGVTTQPEYSFWFEDVGWRVENYGTEPDLEVEITPADYAAGRDPQLEAALNACLEGIRSSSPRRPRLEPGLDHLPQLEPGF